MCTEIVMPHLYDSMCNMFQHIWAITVSYVQDDQLKDQKLTNIINWNDAHINLR